MRASGKCDILRTSRVVRVSLCIHSPTPPRQQRMTLICSAFIHPFCFYSTPPPPKEMPPGSWVRVKENDFLLVLLGAFASGTWGFGRMHSEIARGEQCRVQHIPRAAQPLTVRAGRIAHWEERAGAGIQASACWIYPWLSNIFLSAGMIEKATDNLGQAGFLH